MNTITLRIVPEKKINSTHKESIKRLQDECFGDVDASSIEEDFIAESFARIFAYSNGTMVGMLRLFKRKVEFAGKNFLLGGLGGVCVAVSMRRMGVASAMVKKGLVQLKKHNCDIACLNVDTEKGIYGVYEKAGFMMMERDISYENSNGEIKLDTGTMFAPICSPDLYEYVMKSRVTFHYGKGYW